MRQLRLICFVLVVALAGARQASAQSLTLSLFERYLDSLREGAAIPAVSAAIVQNGSVVWKAGLGKQDVDANVRATPDTPYAIGGVTQALGSVLLLRKCVEQSYLEVSDRVVRWDSGYPEPQTTVRDLLTHTSPGGAYHLDLSRFAALTPVIDQCAGGPLRKLMATELFDALAMRDSVPGQTMATPSATDQRMFDASTLERYASVLRRIAVPYKVSNGHATKSEVSPRALDMSSGVVSTVMDLASFDVELTRRLLDRDTVDAAWSTSGKPTGLGWFVQRYNGERLVWQYGLIKDAYSSLVLKLPDRDITLILLANSDGLTSPFSLENGDVTVSPYARLFLRLATGQ